MVPALAFMNCRLVKNIADLLADSYSDVTDQECADSRGTFRAFPKRDSLSHPLSSLFESSASSTFMPLGEKQVFPKRMNLRGLCWYELP